MNADRLHVALVYDEEVLVHDGPSLTRLTVGLLADGVRVTRILPQTMSETVDPIKLAAQHLVPFRTPRWLRRSRRRRLAAAMDKQRPQIVLARGPGGWGVAADVAEAFDIPLAIETWCEPDLGPLATFVRRAAVDGLLAPTAAMASCLRSRFDTNLVHLVPAGVAVPTEVRPVLSDPESIGIAVIGSGCDDPAYRALLAALAPLVDRTDGLHVFMELRGPQQHDLWQEAQRLGLLDHLSTLPAAAPQRRLLVKCDLLVVPERLGMLRSILLESMAAGVPVIAAADPLLDMLEDGVTADLVAEPTADAWRIALERRLSDPDAARALGTAGRARIDERHRSGHQVDALQAVARSIIQRSQGVAASLGPT